MEVLSQEALRPSILWLWSKRKNCRRHWPFIQLDHEGTIEYDAMAGPGASKDPVLSTGNTLTSLLRWF